MGKSLDDSSLTDMTYICFRDDVLEMVALNYSDCLIDPLTFCTLASRNKVGCSFTSSVSSSLNTLVSSDVCKESEEQDS